MMDKRTIKDFFNKEYKDYSLSVIEDRAISSIIDGFKPTQRKVIFIADKLWKGTPNDKPIKVFQLTGRVAADANYHHGDMALNQTIINMNQSFKNNIPLLEGDGQYGSLRSPNAGAPRYVGTKLSPNFRLLYKDFELLHNRMDEGIEIEPSYFLPIIPTILVNGSSGIAVGFASNILNRNPKDVIQNCINYLTGKKISLLTPWYSEFSGTFDPDPTTPNKWIIKGKYEVVDLTTVKVTELPLDMTYEKYESYLENLIDKKKIIDYDNNSSSTVEYIIKFKKVDLANLIQKGELETFLKLKSSDTENITVLDENNKLKIFNLAEEIIPYFCDFRLKWYQTRKDYYLNKYQNELTKMSQKAKFIKGIIEGTIKINNVPKQTIISQLKSLGFTTIDNTYDYLLNMGISKLTKEEFDELKKQIGDTEDKIKTLKSKNISDMYLDDLNELLKKIKP